MKLTPQYRLVRATFESEINYSRIPHVSIGLQQYYFEVGPLEYRVQFDYYDRDTYTVIFRPVRFNGTEAEQVAFYEKVTGQSLDETTTKDVDWLLDEWLDSRESIKVVGAGSAFKVVSNVISVINRFLRSMDSKGEPVQCLHFSADREEESRVSLYSRIVKTYQKEGYIVHQMPSGVYHNYYVCRPEYDTSFG